MVKKVTPDSTPDPASPAGLFESPLASQVKESAQQICLAGMGAFAKAQAEGRQVFESLVKDGAALQKKTQEAAEERVGDVTQKASSLAEGLSAKAGQQWGRLESIFEERTAKALKRLGVPTAHEVEALSARIDALTEEIARLKTRLAEVQPAAIRSDSAPPVPSRPTDPRAALEPD